MYLAALPSRKIIALDFLISWTKCLFSEGDTYKYSSAEFIVKSARADCAVMHIIDAAESVDSPEGLTDALKAIEITRAARWDGGEFFDCARAGEEVDCAQYNPTSSSACGVWPSGILSIPHICW